MKLVLIHGRAQGGKDHVILKKTWIDTLEKGLEKSNLKLPISQDDIVFPYYGDLLDQLAANFNMPVETIIERGSSLNNKDARFFHDFFLEIAENSNISSEEIDKEKSIEITERGPLNWEWVHSILKAIDRKTTWSEATLRTFTYDVFLYLTVPIIRQKIDNLIKSQLPKDSFVVVGHSLGSVVGYNILRDFSLNMVSKFITVGSPLGVNAVKRYLKTPLIMPQGVRNGWYNAYDEGDVVALNPLDKNYFNITPPIVNMNRVKNQTSNQHGIEGYLNDKTVAKEIFNALSNL